MFLNLKNTVSPLTIDSLTRWEQILDKYEPICIYEVQVVLKCDSDIH